MASYRPPPGHGPAPNMPPSVLHAAKLPPLVTSSHVFFFGFQGPEPENCFQQWYPSPFTDDSDTVNPGARFPTTEHYMMYHKALIMKDEAVAGKILVAATPAEAKSYGREVKGFVQEKWDEACDRVVEEGNFLKFTQNKRLGGILVATGEREIVEASPNDKIWGIGFNSEEAIGKEAEWGENKLGKALMRVRARLLKEGAKAS